MATPQPFFEQLGSDGDFNGMYEDLNIVVQCDEYLARDEDRIIDEDRRNDIKDSRAVKDDSENEGEDRRDDIKDSRAVEGDRNDSENEGEDSRNDIKDSRAVEGDRNDNENECREEYDNQCTRNDPVHGHEPIVNEEQQELVEESELTFVKKRPDDLKRLVGKNVLRRNFEEIADRDDSETYRSTELNEILDTTKCYTIFTEVSGIKNAVKIEVSLKENHYPGECYYKLLESQIEKYELVTALHVDITVDPILVQKLLKEKRGCLAKLESELWDTKAGVQLDLKVHHHCPVDTRKVNYTQHLVGEKKLGSSLSESVNLLLKARVYTYSKENL